MSQIPLDYQVLDPSALTNEALGALYQQGYASDPRLIVFVRPHQATGDGRQAGEGEPTATPEDHTPHAARQTPSGEG